VYIDCTIFEEWCLKLNKWAYSKPQLLTITTTDASWKKSIDFSALIVQWVGGFGVGGGHSFFRIQPWRSKIKDIMDRFDTLECLINAHYAFILFKTNFALCCLIRYCVFILFFINSRPVWGFVFKMFQAVCTNLIKKAAKVQYYQ
jgi:hypothetical protein